MPPPHLHLLFRRAAPLHSRGLLQLQRRSYSVTTPPLPPLIHVTLPSPTVGHIHILLLNSPATRNALSTALLASLHTHLDALSASPPASSLALILASTTPTSTFCAGADLKERATFTPPQTRAFLTSLRAAFTKLESLPLPTIAAINGPALGGGLEMALAADFRVFGPGASAALPETRLGIIPGAGGTYRLPRVVGEARALEMVLTGRRVGGEEALGMGLATRFVRTAGEEFGHGTLGGGGEDGMREALQDAGVDDKDRLVGLDPAMRGALDLAREICGGAPLALRAAKEAVRGWRGGEGEGAGAENRAYEKVVGTRDRDEALRAFREKRRPVFRGE